MAAIGVLTLELRLENSHSLKEKRHVVQSLKDRLRHKFNVSVAEIDHQDLWQRSTIAAVTVSSARENAEKVIRALAPRGIVVVEYFHADSEDAPGGFADNELLQLFGKLRVVRYEDTEDVADFGMRKTRVVRLCAEKRP